MGLGITNGGFKDFVQQKNFWPCPLLAGMSCVLGAASVHRVRCVLMPVWLAL